MHVKLYEQFSPKILMAFWNFILKSDQIYQERQSLSTANLNALVFNSIIISMKVLHWKGWKIKFFEMLTNWQLEDVLK